MKTHLTPDEKLRAAHAHLILGVDMKLKQPVRAGFL